MARVTFDSLFKTVSEGSFEPRQRLRIGGIVVGPGVRFSAGVAFAGVDFTQYQENDFEIDIDEDVIVLKSIYAKES